MRGEELILTAFQTLGAAGSETLEECGPCVEDLTAESGACGVGCTTPTATRHTLSI